MKRWIIVLVIGLLMFTIKAYARVSVWDLSINGKRIKQVKQVKVKQGEEVKLKVELAQDKKEIKRCVVTAHTHAGKFDDVSTKLGKMTNWPKVQPSRGYFPVSGKFLIDLEPGTYTIEVHAEPPYGGKWFRDSLVVLPGKGRVKIKKKKIPEWTYLITKGKGIKVWYVTPNKKIFPDSSLPLTQKRGKLFLKIAKREYECFQIALKSEKGNKVKAIFEDLVSPSEKIGKENLSFNPVGFVNVIEPSAGSLGRKGPFPDPLLKEKYAILEPGKITSLWITLYIPPEVSAGTYKTRIILRFVKGEDISIPLKVKVWNFTLPPASKSHLTVQANHSQGLEIKYSSLPPKEAVKQYLENFAHHRVNAVVRFWDIPAFLPGRKGVPSEKDKADFREMGKFARKMGFRRIRFEGGYVSGSGEVGKWCGYQILLVPKKKGDIWLRASQFRRSFVASKRGNLRWERGTMSAYLNIGRLGDVSDFNGSWVEYNFNAKVEGNYKVWILGNNAFPREVIVDGKSLGVTPKVEKNFVFVSLPKGIYLGKGMHTLKIVIKEALEFSGHRIDRIFLSMRKGANPQEILSRRPLNPEFLKAYAYHLKHMGNFLKETGWLDKAVIKIWDEPSRNVFPIIKEIYKVARRTLPEVKIEAGTSARTTLSDILFLSKWVDVWGIDSPWYNEDFEKKVHAKGGEIMMAENWRERLDYPALSIRLLPWELWKYNIDEHHFWGVDVWRTDPWKTPVSQFKSGYCAGIFLYPDPKDGSPVNSIRWELFREGLEDYEYLRLLEKEMNSLRKSSLSSEKKEKILEECKEILEEVRNKIVPNFNTYSRNAEEVESIREKVGSLIEDMKKLLHE